MNSGSPRLATIAAVSVAGAPIRRAAVLTLVTVLVDLVVLGAFHLIQPDVDPVTSATSDYVHGTAGALSHVATFAVGLGAVSLVATWWPAVAGAAARVGLGLLVIFGAAKLVQAFFPIDAEGADTSAGRIHDITGNLAFFTLPIAAVLIARAIARRAPAPVVAVLAWAVVVATVGVLVGDALDAFGIGQRIYLVLAALWTAATAAQVFRAAPQPRS